MATGALGVAAGRNVVSLGRGKSVAGRHVATGTGRRPGVIHRRRQPTPSDAMTIVTGVRRHGCHGVRLGTGRYASGRGTVMTGGAIPPGDAGMGERGRDPGGCGMTTRALRIASGRDVIRLGRRKAVTGSGMAAGTAGQAGMIHGGRDPGRADAVAATAGVVGQRSNGMRLGTAHRPTGGRDTVMATGRTVGRAGHAVMGAGRRLPGRGRMAGGAFRRGRDMRRRRCDRPVIAGLGVTIRTGCRPGMVHRREGP